MITDHCIHPSLHPPIAALALRGSNHNIPATHQPWREYSKTAQGTDLLPLPSPSIEPLLCLTPITQKTLTTPSLYHHKTSDKPFLTHWASFIPLYTEIPIHKPVTSNPILISASHVAALDIMLIIVLKYPETPMPSTTSAPRIDPFSTAEPIALTRILPIVPVNDPEEDARLAAIHSPNKGKRPHQTQLLLLP